MRRSDGERFPDATGSALIHYVLKAGRSRPSGRFVTLAELAGPLFKHGGYSGSALELPIIKRFRGRVPELLAVAASVGGCQGGEAGLGSVSLIFDLLPHVPLQLFSMTGTKNFPPGPPYCMISTRRE